MNMYGESANIMALKDALDKEKVKYKIDCKSLHDKINFLEYDFIYIGTGQEESYSLVLEDLKKYKEDLKKYIESNKEAFRIIGEQTYTSDLIKHYIIGFQNRNTVIKENLETPLFKVTNGTGYTPNEKEEGIRKNNFYGTYLLGPLLIRNPYLLEYFVRTLLENKKMPYKALPHDIAYKAYNEYLNNFVNKEQ